MTFFWCDLIDLDLIALQAYSEKFSGIKLAFVKSHQKGMLVIMLLLLYKSRSYE